MKNTLRVLAVATLLSCTEINPPQKQSEIFGEKVVATDFLKYDSDEVKQAISEVLDSECCGIQHEKSNPNQQHIKEMVFQIEEPIILGDLNQPNVAITIDDGYGEKSIEYMLDLFEKNDVRATFFVIWDCLKLHSNLWKRAVQQWHEICNHTQTHSKYFKTWDEPERFEKELLWWEVTVKAVLWEDYFIKMKKNYPFFRFPWMHWIREKAYLDILKKHGYIPIWWRYTENPKDGVVNNGDIFLWHFKDQDTTNVRKSLEMILKNGKYPKTVSDMITSEAYDEPIWWHNVYRKKQQR